MKTLIFVRHGCFNYSTLSLTEDGRNQIRALVNGLKPFIYGNIAVLSSPTKRTTESAQILVEGLGLNGFETFEEFRTVVGVDDMEAAKKVIDRYSGSDVVIVVAHADICQPVPVRYGFEYEDLERGGARVLHLDTQESTLIGG